MFYFMQSNITCGLIFLVLGWREWKISTLFFVSDNFNVPSTGNREYQENKSSFTSEKSPVWNI